MKQPSSRKLQGAVLAVCALVAVPVSAEVKLLGVGTIPGTATDRSGLTNLLEDGVTPHNLVGGLGSAVTYTGFGNFYWGTPDRGPADGTTSYIDRAYLLRIDLRSSHTTPGAFDVKPSVVDVRLLSAGLRRYFTGNAGAFDATGSTASLRFDPEGIRSAACGGSFFVSDEYGPYLYEFAPDGRRVRSLPLPNKLLADLPSANPNTELAKNAAGRQANRGMEGLAISPDGSKLYGIMQSALIQDGGLDAALKRVGTNNRIIEVDVKTGALREFLYTLEGKSYGVSEILAVNDHEFLVLERDGNAGAAAAFKRIYKIDITDATDIRDLKELPSVGIPSGVLPVTKSLFIDLLDPAFGIAAGATPVPEKWEGLAFGPDLPDGRHLLFVTTDNDFQQAQPTRFYAFALEHSDLIDYVPQEVRLLCPREH